MGATEVARCVHRGLSERSATNTGHRPLPHRPSRDWAHGLLQARRGAALGVRARLARKPTRRAIRGRTGKRSEVLAAPLHSIGTTPLKGLFVATEDTHGDADLHRARSPIKSAAVLLGIYLGIYFAVVAIVRMLAEG